jgi:hypothetical protein
MQGLSSSLQEAKNAAQHLADSLSRLHHKHHLKKDYDKLLATAGAVLRQVEQVCGQQLYCSVLGNGVSGNGNCSRWYCSRWMPVEILRRTIVGVFVAKLHGCKTAWCPCQSGNAHLTQIPSEGACMLAHVDNTCCCRCCCCCCCNCCRKRHMPLKLLAKLSTSCTQPT